MSGRSSATAFEVHTSARQLDFGQLEESAAMRAWHDFYIVGYDVDGIRRELSFKLVWPYDTPRDARRARIIFEGVEAYFLEHDLGSNIVYDFAERPLRGFLDEWTQRFESGAKYGWPGFWRPAPYPQRPVEVEIAMTRIVCSRSGARSA